MITMIYSIEHAKKIYYNNCYPYYSVQHCTTVLSPDFNMEILKANHNCGVWKCKPATPMEFIR